MFHFQTLDVYKCAVAFLPVAYSLSKLGDAELASQLRRAALSINLNIAEGTGRFGKAQIPASPRGTRISFASSPC